MAAMDQDWATNLGCAPKRAPGQSGGLVEWDEANTERALTYSSVEARASAIAFDLKRKGLKRGNRVAILAANSVSFLPALLGIVRGGMVAVPISTKLQPEVMRKVLADAQPELAYTDRSIPALNDLHIHAVDIDHPAGLTSDASGAEADVVDPGNDEIALILYTSGSSGSPKGVLLSHHGLLWALRKRLASGALGPGDRAVIAAPMYHMNGLVNALMLYFAGGHCLVLKRFDVDQYIKAIADFKPSSLVAVPTMMALLAKRVHDSPVPDFSSVRSLVLGSAPTTNGLVDALAKLFPNARVTLGYGATETGPLVFSPVPRDAPSRPLALGKPYESVEVKLIDGEADDVGELMVRSPSVARGYLNNVEATRQKFDAGWYRTGDIMRRDADGYYYFVGRNDDMFVCGGENVYPEEVENVLEQHPDILQAAVVSIDDEIKGQIPVAFVVLRSGSQLSQADIKAFALARGLTYQHPRHISIVGEIPVTSGSKIDKKALTRVAIDAWRAPS